MRQRTAELEEQIGERRKSAERAEQANRAKSDFLSRMSHELRTPMNGILGFAQVLARKEMPPEQARHVQHILRAGRHLLELINEVLDLSRIEANQMRLSTEPVAIAAVARESAALVQHVAKERGCVLRDECAESEMHVRADRQRLTQALVNLLSNGAKYNRAGGSVTLSYDTTGGRARIRVSDTGLGIAPEKIGRLFSPFDRLGAEDSDIEGTGLGLSLSQRLIDVMAVRSRSRARSGRGRLLRSSCRWPKIRGRACGRATTPGHSLRRSMPDAAARYSISRTISPTSHSSRRCWATSSRSNCARRCAARRGFRSRSGSGLT